MAHYGTDASIVLSQYDWSDDVVCGASQTSFELEVLTIV